ncbi:hypothetical protein [Aquimarina sediminis]|uniref:hypothetical protein n=1 Tax=Aquimarina sediminis TaxID=2070536 RepID=UPI000CA0706B|nr:hypothetical protein [Aquimarina sediminis]
MLRIIFLGVVLASTLSMSAQKSINDFKYVVVPESYSFLKGTDVYQINSLTKFLFNKYGFNAFMDSKNFPSDLNDNGCKALKANVKRRPGVFTTKLTVELIDCNGTVVFTSSEGKSREKDFKPAYHEALRNAFKDVAALKYAYSGDVKEKSVEKTPVKEEAVVEKEKPVETKKEESTIKTPTESSLYIFNDSKFIFKKQEYGYEIFKNEGEQVSIGKIFKSANGKNYIVQGGDLSGNGYFDGYGNFVLERINPVTNKLITDTFARQ